MSHLFCLLWGARLALSEHWRASGVLISFHPIGPEWKYLLRCFVGGFIFDSGLRSQHSYFARVSYIFHTHLSDIFQYLIVHGILP